MRVNVFLLLFMPVSLANASVLITGGTGAIGSGLCKKLLERGVARLTIIDDFSSSHRDLVAGFMNQSNIYLIEGSVTDEALLDQGFSHKPTIVFHLAANFANQNSVEHPLKDCEVNSLGTLKVVERAHKAGVQKFVYASSSCVYGNESSDTMKASLHLDTPYAINKLHGELLTNFYHQYHGMPTVVLRYFNSFGPGELPGRYRNVIPNFFARAMKGMDLPITGDETISRDFNYVGNTIAGTLLAAESDISNGQTYNIGSGKETLIIDIAKRINALTGNTAGITMHPRRAWDTIAHRTSDIRKTRDDLGYVPEIDLDKHLAETYTWLKEVQPYFIDAI